MLMNKRGQGLSIQAIILIILAVLVLVVVIIGFTVGWSKVLPFIKPANNINELKDKCNIACSTDSKYDYCTLNREVRIEDDAGISGLNDEDEKSCSQLSGIGELGIQKCPGLCDVPKPQCSDGADNDGDELIDLDDLDCDDANDDNESTEELEEEPAE